MRMFAQDAAVQPQSCAASLPFTPELQNLKYEPALLMAGQPGRLQGRCISRATLVSAELAMLREGG